MRLGKSTRWADLTICLVLDSNRAGALVQWLKLPAWRVESMKETKCVFSQLTRKNSIFWGASVTEKQRARPQTSRFRISNPESGAQCHLFHLTILMRFSWFSLAYMCTKVAQNPISFISFLDTNSMSGQALYRKKDGWTIKF